MNDKEARHMLDNLRLIHAAYDAKGADLSAWPWKAADEIERLRELNKVLEAGFFEAAKQIAKSDPAGVALWLREQGFMTQNARRCHESEDR